ncbi:MAG TPA: 2-oxo-4-hydroxy-4-carboxy-5-ureidoimidazoline decarboxylase [Ferruginibacter sp.]|nr:2-oxo-4-hydroxy-4-carboxy-5-ureidoimidazoline decarboxylase [Ferruginibacter sp.]HMP21848.1 2-oxo-4-hydroxy-4-carboxy-5-ureidoimidazoline decarboxylase [Ferruginibacter sp.]
MTLHELNILPKAQLKEELFKCCGSTTWVEKMLPFFPADDMVELLNDAEDQWYACSEADWLEAFTHHPKIGDIESLKKKFASTAQWAGNEQGAVNAASEQTLQALAKGNEDYEKKFGFIFIVCATGKSADEMLALLNARLPNSRAEEINNAMEEQNKITLLRLQKLLS